MSLQLGPSENRKRNTACSLGRPKLVGINILREHVQGIKASVSNLHHARVRGQSLKYLPAR